LRGRRRGYSPIRASDGVDLAGDAARCARGARRRGRVAVVRERLLAGRFGKIRSYLRAALTNGLPLGDGQWTAASRRRTSGGKPRLHGGDFAHRASSGRPVTNRGDGGVRRIAAAEQLAEVSWTRAHSPPCFSLTAVTAVRGWAGVEVHNGDRKKNDHGPLLLIASFRPTELPRLLADAMPPMTNLIVRPGSPAGSPAPPSPALGRSNPAAHTHAGSPAAGGGGRSARRAPLRIPSSREISSMTSSFVRLRSGSKIGEDAEARWPRTQVRFRFVQVSTAGPQRWDSTRILFTDSRTAISIL